MGLSVIVTAYRSAETLRECVETLGRDPDVTQILVADCSERPPELPVPVRRFPFPTPVPAMRWALLPDVSEPVVACLEGRCLPGEGWGAAILEAHRRHPSVKAIGGAVEIAEPARYWDRVVWFCEYSAYAPPLADGAARDVSGAHLTYKTAAVRAEADLLRANAWETLFHLRWQGAIRTIPAAVRFRNGMGFLSFVRQRFHYGRGYAASRSSPSYVAITPILPFLLTWRTFRRPLEWLPCLPGILLSQTAWSLGEAVGYLAGPPRQPRIY